MSQESVERFREIWGKWSGGKYPQNAKLGQFLTALEDQTHAASVSSSGDLRAVQCILLDSESVGAPSRLAIHEVTRCLGDEWSMEDTKDVNFVQAMLLAVRPKAPSLAELMVAGRAAQRGRNSQQSLIPKWLNSAQGEPRRAGGSNVPTVSFVPRSAPSFANFDAAVEYLLTNSHQDLRFSGFSSQLLTALDELNLAIGQEVDSKAAVDWGDASASRQTLQDNKKSQWNYAHFGSDLNILLSHLIKRITALGSSLKVELVLRRLTELQGNAHGFNIYGKDLVQTLVQIKSEILQTHHTRETQSWQQEYRRWAEAVTALVQPQALASAEQQLLWWGQSRYCSPLRCSYRTLRSNLIETVWWAAVEVAEIGKPLEFAPLSAFLVNALETLGLDVNEKKPASDWLASLGEILKAYDDNIRKYVTPKDPLKSLAEKDALGLPVTWLRLKRTGELSSAVALNLELEIDLGEFSEWILGELLLDHRMAL